MTVRLGRVEGGVSGDEYWRVIPEAVLRSARPLRPQERAQLWRIVERRPQAVVRAGAGIGSRQALRAHLNYISRGGVLPLMDREGMLLNGRPAHAELAQDWSHADDCDSRRRTGAAVIARPLVVAAPPGSPPRTVFTAAHEFAVAQYGARHDFVLALHTDRPHPHAHIVFRVLGDDGVRLLWTPEALEQNRARYAEALRRQGLEVDASSRQSRGLVGRTPSHRYWRALQRYWDGRGDEPRKLRRTTIEARDMATGAKAADELEQRLIRRQASVRESFEALTDILERSADPEDGRLARALRGFVRDMPAPLTERARLAQAIFRQGPELRRPLEREITR